jgi:hypothetical protein
MTLTIFTNVSYASFPVKAKINEPDSSSSLTFFVIAILVSALGLFYNKRKYGTFYNPNKKHEEWLLKNCWIILLVVIGVLALGMSAMSMN